MVLSATKAGAESMEGFPYALELARNLGTGLGMLIIRQSRLSGALEEAMMAATFAAQAGKTGVGCTAAVRAGAAATAIVQLAKEEGTGVIVMGSHGRSGLARLLMGSVTEKVIGHAPCPVLVVR